MIQIAKDLNIYKYCNETTEAYGGRILYAAIAAWAKVQLLGESYSEILDKMNQKDFSCVTRQYITIHVKKAAGGLIKAIPHIVSWIMTEEGSTEESALSKYIIEQLIFCYEINRLSSSYIFTNSPEHIAYFKHNELLLGGVSWNNDSRNAKSIGIGNWRPKSIQIEKNYKNIFNIPAVTIPQYYMSLQKNAQWQPDELFGEYEYFQVNKQGLHYYAWDKFEKSKMTNEIVLLRNLNDKKQYMLAKCQEEQYFTARLDQWYVKEREIERIMYCLQYQSGTPCIFNAKKTKDVVELYCHSMLPNPELRIMLLSSWPKRRYNDEYHRLVPIEIWTDIEEMLNELGITVVFKN